MGDYPPRKGGGVSKTAHTPGPVLTPVVTSRYNGRAWTMFYGDGDTERPICTFHKTRASEWAGRVPACVTACAGMADPVTTVRDILAALEEIRDYCTAWMDGTRPHAGDGLTANDIREKARAAIKKARTA